MTIRISVLVIYATALAANAANLQRRISRGEIAEAAEFPYQALFIYHQYVECGGALISTIHVLLAGHCFDKYYQNPAYIVYMTVLTGSTHLFHGQSHSIKRISRNVGYRQDSVSEFRSDIGIIHLGAPVQISPHVAPIALPSAYFEVPDQMPVVISGFGSTSFGGTPSQILLKLNTTKIATDDCLEFFPENSLSNSNMCTRGGEGAGCCTGDSGGPLVDVTKSVVWGVLSGGTGYCDAGYPDVYVKVSHFLPYLYNEITYDVRNPIATEHPATNFYGYGFVAVPVPAAGTDDSSSSLPRPSDQPIPAPTFFQSPPNMRMPSHRPQLSPYPMHIFRMFPHLVVPS